MQGANQLCCIPYTKLCCFDLKHFDLRSKCFSSSFWMVKVRSQNSEYFQDKNMNATSALCCDGDEEEDEDGEAADMEGTDVWVCCQISVPAAAVTMPSWTFSRIRGERVVGNRRGTFRGFPGVGGGESIWLMAICLLLPGHAGHQQDGGNQTQSRTRQWGCHPPNQNLRPLHHLRQILPDASTLALWIWWSM